MPRGSPVTEVRVSSIRVGGGNPLALIAGPCVIEGEAFTLQVAEGLRTICDRAGIPLIFKASYDKANRTSGRSFRGSGVEEGLRILEKVRQTTGLPVTTDVHDVSQVTAAAAAVDLLQIPAFLCRQTDLLSAAARTGKPVNVKKGQFLAPQDARNIVDKLLEAGNPNVLLTERGTTFGYHNLVVDMRALPVLRSFGCPVVFDATHSVQLPGGAGTATSGQREYVAPLARAAVAVGIDALFLEVHPDPDRAPSDGPNMLPLHALPSLLAEVMAIARVLTPPFSG
ncbi:MAG: 3-deoxy-8-phosphooctulonate synthase [candidate division NC10 bacterium]|nr:3-deoxy-8-phosphooctulonate synthase [candidate division NC10 bacterium]